jgi:hypothetical protein
MRTLSLRARLTLWYVLVLVGVLAIFAGDVLIIQRRIGVQRIDRELDATYVQLTNMLREELRELDAPQLAAEESGDVIASPGRALAILSPDGTVLASRLETLNLRDVAPGGPPVPGERTVQAHNGAWRVHVRSETLDGVPMLLVLASPLSELARDQGEIREAIFLGIPIALLFATGGGLWLATTGLRPITTMAQRAANIPLTGMEDLGARRRTGTADARVQRTGDAAADRAADAAPVHGGCVSRTTQPGIGDPGRRRRGAQS